MSVPIRRSQGLASAIVILLSVQAVTLGLRLLALSNRIKVAGQISRHEWVSQATADRADVWVGSAGGLWVLVFVATIVVWCVWQHRSHRAARSLVTGMELSPGWAVGCWFVPIVNYFKPFQAMAALWRASDGTPSWRQQATWPVLGWWWATWLGFNLLGSLQSATSGTDLDAIRRTDALGAVAVTLGVVSAVLAIRIVRQIASRLEAAVLAAATSPGPAAPGWTPVAGLPHPPGPPLPPPPGR